MLVEPSLTQIAIAILQNKARKVPNAEEEIRQQAYVLYVGEDFLAAHEIRLNKNRYQFTIHDWSSVLRLSGFDNVNGNSYSRKACKSHGLIE